jgi:flagellar hook-basal body protein
MARLMTDRINQQFGDERYFNLDGELFGEQGDEFMTIKLTDEEGGDPVEVAITFVDTDFVTGTKQISAEALVKKIQDAIDDEDAFAGEGANALSLVQVSYNKVTQRLEFDTTALELKSSALGLQLFSQAQSRGLFGLSEAPVDVMDYKAVVIPNGSFRVPQDEQRFGIKVQYDEDRRTFSVLSGRTGDTSSVRIRIPPLVDGDSGVEPVADNRISQVFGFVDRLTEASLTPLRGVESNSAVLKGNIIGLNLSNKFRVDESNNQFVVTVDNVTGIITIPPKAEYSAEEFRQALENRINALSDQYGRTVSGVKVNIEGSTNKYFTFTSGTAGDNSFVKVTANSIWGLANVPSARGSTSTWQVPQQARNDAGFPLYVDRNGQETSNPGDFSDAETADLWAPVYLDNGELTFDSSGKISSPNEAIEFKSATIGESGATLKFSISYGSSTQYSSPFSVRKQDQNGRPEGDLIGVEIGDDGLVSASYSNGTQKSLAKIVLANFATPTGLRQIGDSSYYASAKSGSAKYGEAGSAGFGTLRAGARERANVDLTQELVDLITAQRNFQANAKAIETNNTLTQAIINLRS